MLFSYKKELVINYAWYSMGFIIPGLLSFLLIPFILRSFGAEVYAQYSIAFNTLAVVTMFCYGWIGHSYIRFHSAGNEQLKGLASAFLLKSLLFGFVLFSVLIFTITDIIFSNYLVLIPAFFLSGYYSFTLMVLQVKGEAKKLALSEIIRTIINIVIPLGCYLIFENTIPALPLLICTLCFSYAVPILFVLKNFIVNPISEINKTDTHTFKEQLIRYGFPVAVFLSISLALSVNDRFIIAKLIDYKSSGNYAAIYDVMNKGVYFICAPVLMTFQPHIVKQYNDQNKKGALLSLKKAILLETLIFLTGFIMLLLVGKYLLPFILKEAITPDTFKLATLLYIGVFIWQLNMLLHKPLELRLQTKHLAIGVAIAFLLNISANFILLKKYQDTMIAGYTTVGASLFYTAYIIFFSLKPGVAKKYLQ